MSTKFIKVLSFVTTILGISVTLVSGFVQDKMIEQMVVNEVKKVASKNV